MVFSFNETRHKERVSKYEFGFSLKNLRHGGFVCDAWFSFASNQDQVLLENLLKSRQQQGFIRICLFCSSAVRSYLCCLIFLQSKSMLCMMIRIGTDINNT